MGRGNPGGRPSGKLIELKSAAIKIPSFMSANNLIPFIPNSLSTTCTPVTFIGLKGGRYQGFNANIIPDICDTYLDARKNIPLTKNQIPIAETLEIIARALTRVGIAGLINEACGIVTNEKDFLQKILNDYIDKKLQKWVKRFPQSFFDRYKKMYGIDSDKGIPPHIGTFINSFIYGELAPGVLEELKKINPVKENGKRAYAHHRYLTPTIGCPALEKQLIRVNTIMSICKDKKQFTEFYNASKEENDNG